jgi:hypothetical protein
MLLRALRIVAQDNGNWDQAALVLCGEDSVNRNWLPTTEQDLGAVLSYQEALKKLKGKDKADEAGDDDKGNSKEKNKGVGKTKNE